MANNGLSKAQLKAMDEARYEVDDEQYESEVDAMCHTEMAHLQAEVKQATNIDTNTYN